MKKSRLFVLAVVSVLSVFTVFSTMAGATKKLLFVMVPKGVHPYYVPCYQGFKEAGAKYGIDVEYDAPEKFDINLQVKTIEDLIARKVDGIAISALDDAGLVNVIKEAASAGIKVITFDAPAPSSAALTYIGTENEAAGYAAGVAFAKVMNNSGKMIILQGGLGAANLNLRTKGFKAAIAKVAPNIKILDVVDEEGDFSEAVNKTEAVLQTYPDLKGIFAVSAEGTPSAANVIKQQNKQGKILVAGFDDLKDTLDGIKDGSVSFCLVQKTYKMGWLSIQNLQAAVQGKTLPKVIDTGVIVVTKNNVDTYMPDMQKEFAK